MRVLTIFGAGASFDSLARGGVALDLQNKPPLTVGLFEDTAVNNRLLAQYHLGPFVPQIRQALEDEPNHNLERVLGDFWIMAQGKEHRERQLKSVAQYIAHRLRVASLEYISFGSNYERYFNFIYDNDIDYDIATFNYDTLLEDAFLKVRGHRIDSIDAYHVSDSAVLVKLHGSWDWILGDGKQIIHSPDTKREVSPNVYIGLPIVDTKMIICPDDHLNALLSRLGEVDIIVSVGWRGNEPHFFQKLVESGSKNKEIILVTVNNSKVGCQETFENFEPYFKAIKPYFFDKGFSEFVAFDIPLLPLIYKGEIPALPI